MIPKMKILIKIYAFIIILLMTGCSTNKNQIQNIENIDVTPEELLKSGEGNIRNKDYKDAIENFDQIERNFPSSSLVAKSQILKAYSYYSDEKFEEAIMIVDDFLKQYPSYPDIAYMYYLKGICYYDQILDVGRDQENTHKAIDALYEVKSYFPETKYAKDAKWKIEYALNVLAGKEMDIGRFYLRTNKPIAAVGRFKTVVDLYQNTIFIQEALFRLTEIYYAFGILSESTKYAEILGYNYPDNIWYKKAHHLLNNVPGRKVPFFKSVFKKLY